MVECVDEGEEDRCRVVADEVAAVSSGGITVVDTLESVSSVGVAEDSSSFGPDPSEAVSSLPPFSPFEPSDPPLVAVVDDTVIVES